MGISKMGVGDTVLAELGDKLKKEWGREPSEKMAVKVNVHAVLRDANGAVKFEEWGENLVTDYGDQMVAERMYDDATNIVTGMRLGTGATAAAKNGAGAAIVTYITGSQEALDATATDSDKGAGAGHRTQFVCTWIAGDVTNSAIAEVALTNETPLTDIAGVAGNTVARYVFGATIDKQAGDSLEVTWQVDFLGA